MKRILITGEYTDERNSLQAALESALDEEAHFLQADNGKDVLRMLREEQVDLLLLDMKMPVMDGDEVLQSLAGGFNSCATPVIVVKDQKEPERDQELMRLGVLDILCKPVYASELTQAVQTLTEIVII
jgi:CheY-like chemotaxis protein